MFSCLLTLYKSAKISQQDDTCGTIQGGCFYSSTKRPFHLLKTYQSDDRRHVVACVLRSSRHCRVKLLAFETSAGHQGCGWGGLLRVVKVKQVLERRCGCGISRVQPCSCIGQSTHSLCSRDGHAGFHWDGVDCHMLSVGKMAAPQCKVNWTRSVLNGKNRCHSLT